MVTQFGTIPKTFMYLLVIGYMHVFLTSAMKELERFHGNPSQLLSPH